MNPTPFPEPDALEALMLRALEGELSVEESSRLEQSLTEDPALAAEYAEMQADQRFWEGVVSPALQVADDIGDLDDLERKSEFVAPPMPESVLARLREVAAESWAERVESMQRAEASAATEGAARATEEATIALFPRTAPAGGGGAAVPQAGGPFRPALWLALAAALALALVALPRALRPPTAVEVAQVSLLAPTPDSPSAFADPVFVWESGDPPGQRYDVWILPEGGDQLESEALYVAREVASPLPLSAMEAGSRAAPLLASGGYQVLICLAGKGRLSGVPSRFEVAEGAAPAPDWSGATPGEQVVALQQLLATDPEAALMAIAALPEASRRLPEIGLLEAAARERAGER